MDIERVFASWSRIEEFPRFMRGVRRVKQIGDRSLWDVDVAGRQVVWEARIVECVPPKRIRWESRWGAWHSGEAAFASRPDGGTHLEVAIDYAARGLLQYAAARLGIVNLQVAEELERFGRHVERESADRDRPRRPPGPGGSAG